MQKQESGKRYPARGRRYSPAEQAEILKDAVEIGVAKAAGRHGCATWTIYDWRRKAEDPVKQPAGGEAAGEVEQPQRDERHELILELWRQRLVLVPVRYGIC